MPQITLNFSEISSLLVLILALFPALILFGSKLELSQGSFSFSRTTSKQLQGIFILLVVVHHISQRATPADFILKFQSVGYLAVAVFFFISGYGLMKSLARQDNYFSGFLANKVLTILLPMVLINALTTVAVALHGPEIGSTELGLPEFFSYLFSFKLVDETSWFISTIFLFYSFFFISFRKRNSCRSRLTLVGLTVLYVAACIHLQTEPCYYASSAAFPLGVLVAHHEKQLNKLYNRWVNLGYICASLLLISILFYQPELLWRLEHNTVSALFSLSIFIIFSMLTLQSKLMAFAGSISLEIYLIHMKLLWLFSLFTEINSGLWLLGYTACLFGLSFLFQKAHTQIANKLSFFALKAKG